MSNADISRIVQLQAFVDFERQVSPELTHIAEWALKEIEALRAALVAAEARALVAEADAKRLDWVQFHGARVSWGNDDEYCNVHWSDGEDVHHTELFTDWRDAIDAAMAQQQGQKP